MPTQRRKSTQYLPRDILPHVKKVVSSSSLFLFFLTLFCVTIPAQEIQPKAAVGSFCISIKSLSFSKCVLDPLPVPAQTFTMKNCGNTTLSWFTSVTYAVGATNWLTVAPANGALSAGDSATIVVNINAVLPPGAYDATINFSSPNANNSPQKVDVTYFVYGETRMQITPRVLVFQAVQFSSVLPQAQTFTVTDSSRCGLQWSATAESSWVSHAIVGRGQYIDYVNVWMNVTNLPVDTHRTVIRLRSSNASNRIDSVVVYYIINAGLPDAPDSLRVEKVSDTELYLIWRDRSNNEDGFFVERYDSLKYARDTTKARWDSVGIVFQNTSTFLDNLLSPCTKYYYRVRAFNRFGRSGYSNIDSGTTCREKAVLTNESIYAYPNPIRNDRGTTFQFTLSQSADVTIRIVDAANSVHRTIHVAADDARSCTKVAWDGRGDNGSELPNGVYFYLIQSTAGERAVGKIALLK